MQNAVFDCYFYKIFVKIIEFFINFFTFCIAIFDNLCNNIIYQVAKTKLK